MNAPRKTKVVCGRCGADSVRIRHEAWVEANTGKVSELFPELGTYCPSCDDSVPVIEQALFTEDLSLELARWKRRADAALEAMVVRALRSLSVDDATRGVIEAMTPRLIDPEGEHPPVNEVLFSALEALLPLVELTVLVTDLELLWERAHAGEDVSPGALRALYLASKAGAWRSPEAVEQAQAGGRSGVRSNLGLRADYERGSWVVRFYSPSGAWYREMTGGQSTEGRVIASGEHSMLEVAAELCRRSLMGAGA